MDIIVKRLNAIQYFENVDVIRQLKDGKILLEIPDISQLDYPKIYIDGYTTVTIN